MIDLRSDTVSKPTPAMRKAMADAEVGDDVYDDDPTVNRLQEVSAKLLGKEAALFTPSGTMSNAIAMKVHTRPGDEVLMDTEAHSMLYELGLPATIAHVLTRQFRSAKGVPDVEAIRHSFHAESLHNPGTTLILLENTHNRAGGEIIPLEVMQEIYQITKSHDARLHLDGARLFNAVVASGVSAADFAKNADSVTFCLSKGLGCPIGSVLCGTHEFIHRARRVRKMLGGGMRQVGILAAAGLYALENHIERLETDHANACFLAQGLAQIPGLRIRNSNPPTNMVYFDLDGSSDILCKQMKAQNVLANPIEEQTVRLVTHLGVDQGQIEETIRIIQEISEKS